MKKSVLTAAFAAALALGIGGSIAQETAPAGDPLLDTVNARKALMSQIDMELGEMEAQIAEGTFDPLIAYERGAGIAAMMRAFQLLFPAETNYLAEDEEPEVATSADPKIWAEFERFSELATTAAQQADEASFAEDLAALTPAVTALRASCESCHADFLDYRPPTF